MKYLKAKFTNYIGIFNGMGLEEIEIDFTKCQHRIVLITGANGSGKSTILNHLNPFPDGSSCFVPDKTAEKYLVIQSENDIYEIHLISPADLKGRKTTKAYIMKNGIELNENGNVSSYKDIIFSEFELDSNYISLSNLSSTDRGMGDKTPAERKKFVSGIIDNLEIYNTMYKTLNKKSLVYKSHINTLHTKIQNIGDKATLDQRLSTLQIRESSLNSSIMDCNNKIVAIQAKNSIDEDEAREIERVMNSAAALKSECDLLSTELDTFYSKTKISRENVEARTISDRNLLQTYNSKSSELTNIWKDKCNRLSDISNNITSINAELASADIDNSISDRYSKSSKAITDISKQLKALNINPNIEDIFDLTMTITFCDKFVQLLDHFNDNLTPSDISFLVNDYHDKIITDLMNEQNDIIQLMSNKQQELSDIQGQMKVLAILEQRPKNCKIDNCAFIADALKLKKSIKVDLLDNLSNIQEEISSLSDECTRKQEEIDHINSLTPKAMELRTIRSLISENMNGISKFIPEFGANYNAMIANMNNFTNIRDHRRLTDGLNLLKMLEAESQNNKILEVEYNGFKDKVKLINSSKVMLEKLEKEQEELGKETSEMKKDIDSYNNLSLEITGKLNIENQYFDKYTEYKAKYDSLNQIQSEVDKYNQKSAKALESLGEIDKLRASIESYSAELKPVMQEISTISGQLTLLDSYYKEFDEYNKSYNIIETLKKYCSPTGGGIQTLFMQLYMSKTKDLANSVLAMLFNGSYQLLDFIINDSEFRIPFIGEGLPVDDISSGSSAQISMMSMIINLVLLHQGSSKFNIAMLDEVNGPLDAYNNAIFTNVVMHCMEVLQIEQLFMISHSIETDGSFADIIKLRWYDGFDDASCLGNIIFDYQELIK